jgi:hypothetical protein
MGLAMFRYILTPEPSTLLSFLSLLTLFSSKLNCREKENNFISIQINLICFLIYYFYFLFGFYTPPIQYRSYGDFLDLLEEEDLRCHSIHYFRHLSKTTDVL